MFALAGEGRRGLLTIDESGVAYSMHQDGQRGDGLYWVDFATGSTRTLEPVEGWQIVQVQVDKHWIVWVEQDLMQSDAIEPVAWRIQAVRLPGGEPRILLTSKHRTVLAPGIVLHGDTLITSDYRGLDARVWDVASLDLRTGKRHMVLRGVPPVSAFDGTRLVGAVTKLGDRPGKEQSDLYQLFPGPAKRISDTGRASGAQIADGRLMWLNCPLNRRCTMWVQDWPSGTPRAIYTHGSAGPTLGAGFIADYGHAGGHYVPVVIPIDNPANRLKLTEQPPGQVASFYVAAHGHRVAWFTDSEDENEEGGGKLVVADIAIG
ncbi:MAG: hypothetical protein QM655_01815 [Nocardioidaceae bacterium]